MWSQTDLGTFRLTSAVELYGSDGRLVSRFALNLPEYGSSPYSPGRCDWDLSDDISPMGSSESHVLRASRGICVRGRVVGGIVVRAMLDYRTLPFISSQSPYLESLRPDRRALAEGVSGRDVEFAVYGWSRAPIFASRDRVSGRCPTACLTGPVASRAPFWDTIERDGDSFRVYIINDRGGIYVLGYPVITSASATCSTLPSSSTLALVLFARLIGGATIFDALTAGTPASGRALLREVRSSFYRKLFLAFWAAAVLPVVILPFAIRTYFANELTARNRGCRGEDRDGGPAPCRRLRDAAAARPGRTRRTR